MNSSALTKSLCLEWKSSPTPFQTDLPSPIYHSSYFRAELAASRLWAARRNALFAQKKNRGATNNCPFLPYSPQDKTDFYIRDELAIPHWYSKSHKNHNMCPLTRGLYHDQESASPPRKLSRSWQLTCACVLMWSSPKTKSRLLVSCDLGNLLTPGRQRRHESIKAKFIKGHQDYPVVLGHRTFNRRSCL